MTSEPTPSPHGDHQRDTYPDLAGKVAVVTGGSRGIGAATARALASNGTAVAVAGRDHAAIDATVQGILAEGGTALGVAADCTIESDLATLHRKVADDLGPVDILAAFAGGNGMPVPTDTETGERKELAAAFPLSRLGQPDDEAAATLFLAASASSWITGVTLDIAGGKIML